MAWFVVFETRKQSGLVGCLCSGPLIVRLLTDSLVVDPFPTRKQAGWFDNLFLFPVIVRPTTDPPLLVDASLLAAPQSACSPVPCLLSFPPVPCSLSFSAQSEDADVLLRHAGETKIFFRCNTTKMNESATMVYFMIPIVYFMTTVGIGGVRYHTHPGQNFSEFDISAVRTVTAPAMAAEKSRRELSEHVL